MLQIQTKVKISDNTGGKVGSCLKIYKSKKGSIGDFLLISIKKIKPLKKHRLKLVKGDIYKALIIRTQYKTLNFSNNYIRFNQNSIILLNNNKPLGTRIFGPIPIKLRKQKLFKIISLSSILV